MKKTIIIGLSLALGMALMVTASMAWGPGLGRRLGMEEKFGCPDLPILGEKQLHKVEAFQESFLKEIEPLQHDLLKKRIEIRILELAPDPDPIAVKAKLAEIHDLRSELQGKAVNLWSGISKLLNPEQRAHFDVLGPSIGFNPLKEEVSTSG